MNSDKILKVIGLSVGQHFTCDGYTCYFDSGLDLLVRVGDKWIGGNRSRVMDILTGRTKITVGLTDEDKVIIEYAKLCGCKYIACDSSGDWYAYRDKPIKSSTYDEWVSEDCYYVALDKGLSFDCEHVLYEINC